MKAFKQSIKALTIDYGEGRVLTIKHGDHDEAEAQKCWDDIRILAAAGRYPDVALTLTWNDPQ